MRPIPFLDKPGQFADLSTEKWFWMRLKPTPDKMHTI